MTLSRKTAMKRTAFKPKKAAKPCPTLKDLQEKGLVVKASSLSAKPRKRLKPRSPNNKGGQRALFEMIWESRPHKCEVCSAHIEEAAASNFSHLLPKGSYPEFKLREDNIVIKCQRCHDVWHHYSKEHLSGYYMWMPVVDKYNLLKREANGLTQEP